MNHRPKMLRFRDTQLFFCPMTSTGSSLARLATLRSQSLIASRQGGGGLEAKRVVKKNVNYFIVISHCNSVGNRDIFFFFLTYLMVIIVSKVIPSCRSENPLQDSFNVRRIRLKKIIFFNNLKLLALVSTLQEYLTLP